MLKVGQKVKINIRNKNPWGYSRTMRNANGKIVTIIYIREFTGTIRLKEVGYSWHETDLDPIGQFPQKYIDRMKA
jgi:hypothetical protein